MKKILYTALLFISLVIPSMAQRLMPYQPTIELGIGLPMNIDKSYTVGRNYNLYGAFNYYLNRANIVFATAEYELQNYPYKQYDVPVRDFICSVGYMHPLLYDHGRNILLYAGASVLSGYESLNNEEVMLANGAELISRSRVLYGGALCSSVDVFITDNTLFTFKTQLRLCFGTDLNKFRPTCLLGFRFNL